MTVSKRLEQLRLAAARSRLQVSPQLARMNEEEFSALLGIISGYSITQIATFGKTAPREIYRRLAVVKERLGCASSRELVNLVHGWLAR